MMWHYLILWGKDCRKVRMGARGLATAPAQAGENRDKKIDKNSSNRGGEE